RHRHDRFRNGHAVLPWIAGTGARHLGRPEILRPAGRGRVSPCRTRPVAAVRRQPAVPRRLGRATKRKLCRKESKMSRETTFKVMILWRGDAETRQAATPQNSRFHRMFEELAVVGIHAEPAVYDEAFAGEVREQILSADGVLVGVDPIHRGKTRGELDALLRDVAARGPW